MIITVFVNPRSQNERIERLSEGEYKAYFNVLPRKGRANQKLVDMLSGYFSVSKSQVVVRLGRTSKEKVIEILGV